MDLLVLVLLAVICALVGYVAWGAHRTEQPPRFGGGVRLPYPWSPPSAPAAPPSPPPAAPAAAAPSKQLFGSRARSRPTPAARRRTHDTTPFGGGTARRRFCF